MCSVAWAARAFRWRLGSPPGLLVLLLTFGACGNGDSSPSDPNAGDGSQGAAEADTADSGLRSLRDQAGRACTIDPRSEWTWATCDVAPVSACGQTEQACFLLKVRGETGELEVCDACCDQVQIGLVQRFRDCALVSCATPPDCPIGGSECRAGVCARP